MFRITPLLILICLVGSACSSKAVLPTIKVPTEPTKPLSIVQSTTVRPISDNPSILLNTTFAASPTASPSNTITPTKTASITETPTPPGAALLTDVSHIASSPDGNWLWGIDESCYAEEGTDLQYCKTIFARKDGKVVWTVWPKTKDIGNVTASRANYSPIFWLPGESYVYLVGNFCCIDGAYNFTGWNLARLDLRTGVFSIQISGWSPHSFAFSKDGKYLLETHYKSSHLRFIRLLDWKITDIPIDPKYVFNEMAAFSPDQNKAVVQACEEFMETLGCYQYSLLFVNINEEDYKILLENMPDTMGFRLDDFLNNQYYFTYSWTTDNEIMITAQALRKDTRHFILDLDTNQVLEAKLE